MQLTEVTTMAYLHLIAFLAVEIDYAQAGDENIEIQPITVDGGVKERELIGALSHDFAVHTHVHTPRRP